MARIVPCSRQLSVCAVTWCCRPCHVCCAELSYSVTLPSTPERLKCQAFPDLEIDPRLLTETGQKFGSERKVALWRGSSACPQQWHFSLPSLSFFLLLFPLSLPHSWKFCHELSSRCWREASLPLLPFKAPSCLFVLFLPTFSRLKALTSSHFDKPCTWRHNYGFCLLLAQLLLSPPVLFHIHISWSMSSHRPHPSLLVAAALLSAWILVRIHHVLVKASEIWLLFCASAFIPIATNSKISFFSWFYFLGFSKHGFSMSQS